MWFAQAFEKWFSLLLRATPAGHTKVSLENNLQNSAFPKLKLINYLTKDNELQNRYKIMYSIT
jgi:hypothetical protein